MAAEICQVTPRKFVYDGKIASSYPAQTHDRVGISVHTITRPKQPGHASLRTMCCARPNSPVHSGILPSVSGIGSRTPLPSLGTVNGSHPQSRLSYWPERGECSAASILAVSACSTCPVTPTCFLNPSLRGEPSSQRSGCRSALRELGLIYQVRMTCFARTDSVGQGLVVALFDAFLRGHRRRWSGSFYWSSNLTNMVKSRLTNPAVP